MAQPDLYTQLQKDVLQFLRNQSVDDRFRAMILDLVNQALRVHSLQLTNQEKDTLTHDVMKDILIEMMAEYQDTTNHH